VLIDRRLLLKILAAIVLALGFTALGRFVGRRAQAALREERRRQEAEKSD
jgi:hypothetical protein